MKLKVRKGMTYYGYIFSKGVDGEFEDKNHNMYDRYDRKYVEIRLNDMLRKQANGADVPWYKYNLDDDRYLILTRVREGCKKELTLINFGFVKVDVEGLA